MTKTSLCFGLLCAGILSAMLLTGVAVHTALRRQDLRSMQILEKTVSGFLERAHHLNDDLAVQTTVSVVSQAPGVVFAAVLDENAAVLAHTDPSQIGQTWRHRHEAAVSSYSLGDRTHRWGTLLLRLSHTVEEQTFTHLIILLLVLGMGTLAGLMLLQNTWTNELRRVHQQRDEQVAVCKLKEEKIQFLEHTRGTSEKMLKSWIQELVEKRPEPEILLDPQQRVLAMNSRAQERLDLTEKFVENSWHEIPALADCGAALQQSLETPGQPIQAEIQGAVIQFTTALDQPAGNTRHLD